MGLHAGKGTATELPVVHMLTKKITYAMDDLTVEVGYLPKNCVVIGSGIVTTTAWTAGTIAIDLGFDRSEQGATTDPNAFTETALTGGTGHLAGDVVAAANIFFSAPARVTCSPTSSGTLTAGVSYVYVTYVVFDNLETL